MVHGCLPEGRTKARPTKAHFEANWGLKGLDFGEVQHLWGTSGKVTRAAHTRAQHLPGCPPTMTARQELDSVPVPYCPRCTVLSLMLATTCRDGGVPS